MQTVRCADQYRLGPPSVAHHPWQVDFLQWFLVAAFVAAAAVSLLQRPPLLPNHSSICRRNKAATDISQRLISHGT